MLLRKRRRSSSILPQLTFIAFLFLIIWLIGHNFIQWLSSGEADEATAVVNQFYSLEQAGDFGSSWELFHSQMKARYEKENYIQQRAHIFMQHFGVESFEFELGTSERIYNWRMTADSEELPEVYQIMVTLFYKSQYGDFKLVQPCYAAKEDEEWKLLWIFSEE